MKTFEIDLSNAEGIEQEYYDALQEHGEITLKAVEKEWQPKKKLPQYTVFNDISDEYEYHDMPVQDRNRWKVAQFIKEWKENSCYDVPDKKRYLYSNDKYYVYKSKEESCYLFEYNDIALGATLMPHNCANELCNKLNNGTFTLEAEE